MAVNKTDDKRARGRAVEFYQLGFEPVVEMAAEHGEGVGDLLDEIIERLPETPEGELEAAATRSRSPSSAVRTSASRRCSTGYCKEERSIVSDMPGTTQGHRGCAVEVAASDVPDRRYRGDPPGGAGGAQRAARVAERDRGAAGDRARPTWRCW